MPNAMDSSMPFSGCFFFFSNNQRNDKAAENKTQKKKEEERGHGRGCALASSAVP